MHPYRLFILGAGFSRAAGFPLGSELMKLVLRRAREVDGTDSAIEADLEDFLTYKRVCDGAEISKDLVDLEEFVGFLDVEHAMRLTGSDTLTQDGNRSQLAIRRYIGHVLQSLSPARPGDIPQVYHDFVSHLSPRDRIVTFNYDLLLETLLDYHGKSYRLFPGRYSKVTPWGASFAEPDNDIIIHKLHGSIDWFYRRQFDLGLEHLRATGHVTDPPSAVFGSQARFKANPLVDGPRMERDDLSRMFRLEDPAQYYRNTSGWEAPYLLAPSSAKALYASPLQELWYGLANVGGLNLSLSIIGFSMPAHDEYLRQLLYRIVRNYQYYAPDLEREGRTKAPLVIVDYRRSAEELEQLRERYAFVDWSRAILCTEGLNAESLDHIFDVKVT